MKIFILWVALLPLVAADSLKTEADLRQQLAVLEAARTKSEATLKAGLASSVDATRQASAHASDAALSAQIADANTIAILAQAALTAKLQAEQLRHTTLWTSIGMILTQFLALIGIIAGFIHTALMTNRNHRWLVEKAQAASKVIEELEANTNSIKDALVASTAKESYARGKLAAETESAAATRA